MTEIYVLPYPPGTPRRNRRRSPSNSSRRRPRRWNSSLWDTINRLAPLTPNFVSVTYGAGGSTRERTHSTIARILGRDCADARRASDLRRRGARRDRRHRRPLSRSRRPPYRGAARRSARRHRHRLSPPIPMAIRPRPNLWPASRSDFRRYRGLGIRLSRKASRKPRLRRRHRCAEGQGRCRRHPRHHPGLLR